VATKHREVQAMRVIFSFFMGATIALVPSMLDLFWPQSSCSVASANLLLPGAAVSRVLGLRMDSPFFYCATIASAMFYAAIAYVFLWLREKHKLKQGE
jgi:hypothetical protein